MPRKKTLDEFKEEVKLLTNNTYTVLSNEYINNKTKIKLRHELCGNIYEVRPDVFHNGRRCPQCADINKGKSRLKSNDDFKKELKEKTNGRLISLEKYINIDTKILFRCNDCNYEWKTTPYYALKNRCPQCSGKRRLTTDEVKRKISLVTNNEYSLLGEYRNNKTKIRLLHHSCNKEYEVTIKNFDNGNRCPYCAFKSSSKMEKELSSFIKGLVVDKVICNDRKLLEGKEIDIFIPSKKIAFEFNGLYWHSEQMGKKRNYHLEKLEKCNSKGIRLIQIFEDEWVNKPLIVKEKIRHLLKLNNSTKIYARNCYVEVIDNNFKNEFLERNHIQGKDLSSIKLGLWLPKEDGDELVAVMTFSKLRKSLGRNSADNIFELSRFATDMDYRVIGAFSKLLKYFERNYEWKELITYADRRWSDGNVYINNKFELSHISKPNYWYVNVEKTQRFHRFNYRKSNLKKKFPKLYSDNSTEFEIMDKTRFKRIWDCGNLVFTYKR